MLHPTWNLKFEISISKINSKNWKLPLIDPTSAILKDPKEAFKSYFASVLGTIKQLTDTLASLLWIPCSCLSVPSSPQQPLTRYILEFEVEKIVAMGKRKGRWMIKTRWAA